MGSGARLNEYLRSVKGVPFAWGSHDCLTFSNGAFSAYHGKGYADDWLGEYMAGRDPMLRRDLRKRFSADTFDEAIERRLDPVGHIPPKGALVATDRAERWLIGYALGICVGTKAAFVSRAGIVYHPLESIQKAWVPR